MDLDGKQRLHLEELAMMETFLYIVAASIFGDYWFMYINLTIAKNQDPNVTFADHLLSCSSTVRVSNMSSEGYKFDFHLGIRDHF